MDQLETKDNPSITAGHLDNNHIYSDTNALSEKVREAIQKEDLEEKTVVAPKMETFVSGSIIPTIVCDDLVKFYNDDNSPFPILEGMIGRVQEGNESGTAITDKTEKDSRDMSIHWQVKDYRIGNFYNTDKDMLPLRVYVCVFMKHLTYKNILKVVHILSGIVKE